MTQSTQTLEELDNCFARTAGNIMKYCDDEKEMQTMLKNLREAVAENCMQYARMKAADQIKEGLECMSEYELQRDAKNLTKDYKKKVSEIQVDLSKDNRLLQYDRQIEDLLQANKAALSNGAGDADADIQLTCSEINVIDPISKTRMTDPVKNTACGHVYDRESLVAMLQKNKNTKCPVVGCTNTDYIVLSRCRPDIVTKMYLENCPA
ncbi:PREDICTED: E3 SUMO-protein ligase NSE2-like [Vollenhovia emeryi]|uniref:E3 SUMO-protein ligase NSE2-like n=1 Tax=Vollenhovia emeryi TaxID=411798 RepID=UPI0005F4FC60|nr:PREDICTED: E3 SUMO-protein ligase NSE2-like [Vollenhovia emeryi]